MFDNIRNYFTEKRLGKLRRDLTLIHKSDYSFDPFKIGVPEVLRVRKNAVEQLIENLAWYSSEPEALEQFYSSCSRKSRSRFFWKCKPATVRAVHSGLPALISEKMAIILFGPGIDFKATVSRNGKIEEGPTEEVQTILDDMIEKSALVSRLKGAVQTESWSGHVALKICLSRRLDYPVVEVYDRRYFDVVKEHGITTAIIFHSFYERKTDTTKRRFRLDETYTTDEDRTAVIENCLYEIKDTGEREVDLSVLEETAALEPRYVVTGVKGMIAFDKPNRVAQNILIDNCYGQSDFAKGYSVYDALDEIVSVLVEEARTNKTKRYIPTSLIPTDEEGNFLHIDEFVNNYVKVKGDIDQNADNSIDIQTIPDKTDQHLQKYKILVGEACNLSGLSPLSLGITGLESINSSDKSTRERAKTTLETRKDKLDLWLPILTRLVRKMLEIYKVLSPKFASIETEALDVSVAVRDYIEAGIEDRVNTWSAAKMNGVCSIETAVDRIQADDMTSEQKRQEVERIRLEQGLLVDPDEHLLDLDLKEPGDAGKL